METTKKWYSVKETANYFGYSESTIRKLFHADTKHRYSMKHGKLIKVDIEALEKFLKS